MASTAAAGYHVRSRLLGGTGMHLLPKVGGVAIGLAVVLPAPAADLPRFEKPSHVDAAMVLSKEAVQKELGLSVEQAVKLRARLEDLGKRQDELLGKSAALPEDMPP